MKTKTKRIFCFLAALFVVAMLFASTCFASWNAPPFVSTDYYFGYSYQSNLVCYCWSVDNGESYNIAIDFTVVGDSTPADWTVTLVGLPNMDGEYFLSIVTDYYNSVVNGFEQEVDLTPYKQHIINTTLEDLRFVVTYLNTTSQGQAIVNEAIPNFNYQEQVNDINSQTTLNGLFVRDSSYSTALVYLVSYTFDRYMEIVSQPTYQDGYTVGYEQGFLAGEQSQGAYTNGYNTGYSTGYDEGYNTGYSTGFNDGVIDIGGERYDEGYRDGYTDGGKDSGYMKNYLITIFSSPYYILNEVFDFEILGINVATVIMFILSIIIVGFVIKLIV